MKAFFFSKQEKLRDIGLLVIRLGLGVMFLIHGTPKLMGGVEKWKWLGSQMEHLGVDFAPVVWGFMAAFTEFFGALLMMTGFLFRPAMLFLFGTMLVAAVMHIAEGHSFVQISHPIEVGITFLGLLIAGPGRYAVDSKLRV